MGLLRDVKPDENACMARELASAGEVVKPPGSLAAAEKSRSLWTNARQLRNETGTCGGGLARECVGSAKINVE